MIAIIDYGMGNLRSVSKALEQLGASYAICTRGKDLARARKIILPGVGAFGDAMKEIGSRGFLEPLRDLAGRGAKIAGVCLGLQLFFEKSEEAPGVPGLGLLKGAVRAFRSKNVKVPHMGWNDLRIRKRHPVLGETQSGEYFYFVHSYYARPSSQAVTLADCRYGREVFAAAVGNDHLFAAQFHPEKSQDAGLRILANFIRW
ncbi:MAG: imidazole glycerol phosphate synthase subunit HisH [Candidatus Omnitrophica bacterium]|nr:imidazole glycerol phosphate synthase subunit HisH [Candidatus Omnitrophota bacterium]